MPSETVKTPAAPGTPDASELSFDRVFEKRSVEGRKEQRIKERQRQSEAIRAVNANGWERARQRNEAPAVAFFKDTGTRERLGVHPLAQEPHRIAVSFTPVVAVTL